MPLNSPSPPLPSPLSAAGGHRTSFMSPQGVTAFPDWAASQATSPHPSQACCLCAVPSPSPRPALMRGHAHPVPSPSLPA